MICCCRISPSVTITTVDSVRVSTTTRTSSDRLQNAIRDRAAVEIPAEPGHAGRASASVDRPSRVIRRRRIRHGVAASGSVPRLSDRAAPAGLAHWCTMVMTCRPGIPRRGP